MAASAPMAFHHEGTKDTKAAQGRRCVVMRLSPSCPSCLRGEYRHDPDLTHHQGAQTMSTPNPEDALKAWIAAIAAPTAAPAGGAAAAIAGALGAGLVQMVAGLTGARERYARVHEEAAGVVERAVGL